MKNNIITTYTSAFTHDIFSLGVVLLVVFAVLPMIPQGNDIEVGNSLRAQYASAYEFGNEGVDGVGDVGNFGFDGGGQDGGESEFNFGDALETPEYNFDFSSDIDGVGDVGEFAFDTSIALADYQDYDFDFAYAYDGVGDAGDGCCDSDYDYQDYDFDFAYAYDGVGDAGDGCCGDFNYYSYPDYNFGYSYGYDAPDYNVSDYFIDIDDDTNPVCTFTATPSRIESGDTVTLRWATTNASRVSIDRGVGDVARNGSLRVTINTTRTYTLTAEDRDGDEVECSRTITVEDEDEDENELVCTLTATPSRIDEGDTVTLRWTTENATDVSINNGIGDVTRNGSLRVTLNSDRTYTLTAEDRDGDEVECSRTITVDEDEDEEENDDVVCDAFTARPDSISEREQVTLRWSTTGADSVSINNGIGNVSDDGSRVITVGRDVEFVLTARNGNDSDTCTVSIEFDEDDNDNDDVRCDAFTVSDSRVEEGDRVTLSWRTTDADDVRINNGVGDVEDDGSVRVDVDEDTTFTLTARNGNDTDTCRVTVNVEEDDDDDNDNEIPRCRLTISDTSITRTQRVTLSWDNLRTDRIVIRDNHGNEIVDSRDERTIDEDKDSINITPLRSTRYTLTAYNGNTTRTCTIATDVGGVSLTSVRTQDTISLSQVPYTGFEAGPLLTVIFYGVIVLWGIILAYVLVRRKHTVVTTTTPSFTPQTFTPSVMQEVTHDNVHDLVTTIPAHLSTEEVVEVESTDALRTLEIHANNNMTLISSDALRLIQSQSSTEVEQVETLDRVIALAKARFPKENDWVVINKERVISLLG